MSERTVQDTVKNLFTHAYIKTIVASPARFFAFIAIITGLVFVLINPPGFGLDERAHFMRTYLVSNGQIFPERIPPTNQVGAYLPVDLVQFVGTSTKDLLDNNTARFFVNRQDTNLSDYSSFFQKSFSKDKVNDRSTNSQLLAANAYSPFGYIHMAVMTKAVQVLDLPMIYAMYLSRIANLALYIVLVIWAIRVIPRYKWLIVAIALLPTAMYQAASMSLDPFVTALSFVATAYAVKFWLGKKRAITKKQVMLVTAIFIGIALIKTPYAALLLLFIFLPSNRFTSKKYAYIWKAVWVTGALLAAVSWVYVNRTITPDLVQLQPGHASMKEQVQHIIEHPLKVAGVIVKTHYESIDHSLASLLGRAGDRQVGLPNVLVYIFFFLGAGLTAVIYGRSRTERLTKKESQLFKALLGLTTIGIIFLVSLTLYVTFTPVAATTAQGVQGRYFLPILPIAMIFIFRLLNLQTTKNQHTLSIIRLAIVGLLSATILVYYLVNF